MHEKNDCTPDIQCVCENSSFPASIFSFKDNEVESAEEVARRIETAAERLGTERIQYVHPDCGFWMLPRSVADGKMQSLVAGRDLFEGR